MNIDVLTELSEAYELLPVGVTHGQEGKLIKKRRVLVGSTSACDVQINHPSINSIHAVIEISNGVFKVFDMDTAMGTYVNGKKVISEKFELNDTIKFGSLEFAFKVYSKDDLPPPLDMLAVELPPVVASTPVVDTPVKSEAPESIEQAELPKATPKLPKKSPVSSTKTETLPRVEYPLGADPKADFSEYIFEDVETLYPIFDYAPSKRSVEVIILHKDRIHSVDYLAYKEGIYHFVGANPGARDVEYAYLGKKEKIPFVEVKGSDVYLSSLPGYKEICLNDSNKTFAGGQYLLNDSDIVRYVNGDLQVYVRGTDAPPRVAHAPILRRDKEFMKWLFLVFLFCLIFLGFFTFYAVDEELETEKAPERIATILYKPKKLTMSKSKAIDKTKNKPKKVIQKSPKQEKIKVTKEVKKITPKPAKKNVAKTGSKSAKSTAPAKKATANKGRVNKNINKVSPTKKTGGSPTQARNSVRKARANRNAKGAVDTFKSADFSSTLSSLMAKGGGAKSIQAVNTVSANPGSGSSIGGSESSTLTRAKVSNNVGSLTGVASGKLDSSKGVSGLVNKKSIYTAGVPYEEVVLGGMDPDVIRKILVDNIPQFRYCYQQELDKAQAAFNGVVRLDFVIGASGNVTKASVESASRGLPSKVKGCVVNVLRGIKFPEPLGGGVVEVNQPFNFYPKRK
ncbi:hypothetical protein BIY24_01340 [Halobacteriovorax marinus]|uniref:Membrane protein n=1 Tax=Halobacteriovorax marinus (strain ATCC BAA-682 / DSM 15412 / SJ) TaxID=862908 RepID=E1X3A1_HALMS|nr:AgmX/PglI C-terminal domain-containing protein [Halobacteriovorax marinus]ATH06625.1 hypothetical protein BIY24_01340 [Halobacteriovorax marinus]CBW25196.1 putative membrane protein [Halobacteriovorax marinus SJ]